MDAQVMLLEDGTPLVLIHFVYRSPPGVIRAEGAPINTNVISVAEHTWKLACAPGMIELPAQMSRAWPYSRSDDPRAVTCPTCIQSQEFARAKEALERGTKRRMLAPPRKKRVTPGG